MSTPQPDLRSPAETVGGIVYFARMISKVRLHQAKRLPEEFQENLGKGFDGRCVKFLQVSYPALVERVKEGGTDEELLEWCFAQGRRPDEDEIEIWNGFMRKRGWKDDGAEVLTKRKRESGLEDRDDIETMFQYLDADEGRAVAH